MISGRLVAELLFPEYLMNNSFMCVFISSGSDTDSDIEDAKEVSLT